MKFELLFSSKAIRQLKKLPPNIIEKIRKACFEIAHDPWHKGTIKVEGYSNIRRKRVSNWRILYMIDKERREVIIVKVERRDEHTYKL